MGFHGQNRFNEIMEWFPFISQEDLLNLGFERVHLENQHWAYPLMNVEKIKNEDSTVQYYIDLLLPGYSKKDINIEILDNTTLVISGRIQNEIEKDRTHELQEFKLEKSFIRKLILPNIQDDSVNVKLENGILHIELVSGKRVNKRTIELE